MKVILKLLEKWACKHEWVNRGDYKIAYKNCELLKEIKIIYICKKCGKIEIIKL